MAGQQQFTSSLFIQSGSRARFESGLEVTQSVIVKGTITASGFFDLQGNPVGGDSAEFFAGSSSGVSASTPSSVDIFRLLNSGEINASDIVIHTTHSSTFSPNHYVFVKIIDEFETKQSGSQPNYNVGTLSPGVYRYLVYGAQTGSIGVTGDTNQVYTTVFVKGFFNEPPNLVLPTAPTLSIAHDATEGSKILFFTNSLDPNSEDAISFFTASRVATFNPTEPTDITAAYELAMSHSNFLGNVANPSNGQTAIFNVNEVLSTSSLAPGIGLGNNVSPNSYAHTLFFTASISNYNIVNSSGEVKYQNRFDEETFSITLKDENEILAGDGLGESGVTGPENFKLRIDAPPTASISNIRVNFEDDGFTGISSNTLTHTLLYDRTESLSSASIAELPKEYTSSLIRLNVLANIIPPSTFTPPSNHTASIRIQSSSNDEIHIDDKINKKLSFFRFRGGEKTASFFGNGPSVTSNPTESLGFTSFVFKPNFTNNTQSLRIGANTTKNDLNNTTNVQYGNNNHYEAFTTTPNILTIHDIPKIAIQNITIEVESGSYGSNIGFSSLTSSLLYGYTSSLLSSQTQSLLINLIPTGSDNATDHPQYLNYISSSVVRLRVKALIKEPFGPDHKPITVKLTGSNENGNIQHLKTFTFSTHSGILNCIESSSNYNDETKARLVGIYTSSWAEFNFSEGIHTFTAHFASSSNAGSTIDSISNAVVSMSNYNSVQLNNLKYETETFGYSNVDSINTTRKVLYGHDHKILGDSSSYTNHPNSESYASQSVLRMRVKGKITEPFGPATSKIDFNFINKGIDDTTMFGIDNQVFNINTTSSNTYINNQLITTFTSSFIGKDINLSSTTAKGSSIESNFNLSGSFNFTPDSTNEFEGTATISVGTPVLSFVKVIDTPSTIIENITYETETFGHSRVETTSTTRSILYGDPRITNDTSASKVWETHPSASIYASHSVSRFRVKAKIIEPLGFLVHSSSFENKWISSSLYSSSTLQFFTGSTDAEDSSSAYDGQDRLVTSYTSSFMGAILSSSDQNGVNYLFTSGSILHEPQGENRFTTVSGISSNMLVKDTPATIIKDIKYETETHGHSGITATSTTRSVLYGDPHITNATSASVIWVSHPSASTYASHSVTRFKIKAKVIEPLGYLHHSSSFEENISSTEQGYETSSLFDFFTGSSDVFDSSSAYDGSTRLITSYTTSFHGHILSSSVINGVNYLFTSGNILHNPPGENGFTTESGISSEILIKDTPTTIIKNIFYETETFGHSKVVSTSTTRSVLYGDPHITNATSESTAWENHPNSASYASHSVSRFRVRAKVIEPLGPLHHSSSFENKWISSSLYSSSILNFFTGSTDAENSSSAYDLHDRLVTDYTSSFIGVILSSSDQNGVNYLFTSGNILHEPIDENGVVTSSGVSSNMLVKDTPSTIIEEIFYETETFGHSREISTSTTRSILYGDPHITNATSASTAWENHPNSASYASHSVSRFRVRAKIIEPLGPLHHSSSFENKWISSSLYSSSTLQFFTGSTNAENSSSAYDELTRLVTSYTSSFMGAILSSSDQNGVNYLFTSGNILHEPIDENGVVTSSGVSSNMLVKDTPSTIIENIVYETETFGHSRIESTSTTRSVLFGDPHVTNANSASAVWVDHPSASIYASHSVTRFRVKAKITEPLGYLVHSSSFINKWVSSSLYSESILSFFTGSTGVEFSSSAYDLQDRLVVTYTSSYMGAALSSSNQDGVEYIFANSDTLHEPPGENGRTLPLSNISSSVLVKDTPSIIVNLTPIEIETFGQSGIGITNPLVANASAVSRSIRFGISVTDVTGSGISNALTGSSVSRFRLKAKITEPLGYLHSTIKANITFISGSINNRIDSPFQIFSTNSGDVTITNTSYDNQTRFINIYTSSFTGSALSSSQFGNFYWQGSSSLNTNNIISNAIEENGISPIVEDNSIFFVVSSSQNDPTKIQDISVEVESGSFNTNIGHPSLTSSVLYGFTSSLSSSITKSLIDDVVGTSHQNYKSYISQSIVRLRLKLKVIEPFGIPSHGTVTANIITSSNTPLTPSLPLNLPTFNFNTGSTNLNYVFNKTIEEIDRQLLPVVRYTSSFVEVRIPSGSYKFTASLSVNNNIFVEIQPFLTSSVVSMSAVEPTKFEDLFYGTEKFGYAGTSSHDPVLFTTRSVLYGDPHITNATSASAVWENHPSASTYASHSVTRFRFTGKMIEPFGPGTTSSSIELNLNNSAYDDINFEKFNIIPNTGGTYVDGNLVTVFTSSFKSTSISLLPENQGANGQANFIISGNIEHNPSSSNGFITNNVSLGSINIQDTPSTIIEDIIYETETFGHSRIISTSTTRSVLYGDPHITNNTSESKAWTNHPSASTYASHSVSRFRVRAKVTEPLGYLHHSSSFEKQWISSSTEYSSSKLDFLTGSTGIENSSSVYDGSTRLVTSYTSSFIGIILSSSNQNGVNYLFTSGNILHNPINENGFTTASGISSNMLVLDTPSTIIKDISYETETFGHSKISSTSTTRSVLYGDPHITNATSESATWINHPSASVYASHSVTRFRVKAKITEPIGFLVHSSSFENQWISSSQYSSSQLDFFTGSSVIEFSSSAYDTQDRLVVVYTSSFMGAILSSSDQNGVNYLFTSGNILHEPIGENGFTTESGVSSNVLVKDTPSTIIEDISYETETFGHSNISSFTSSRVVLYGDKHVTNATSESTVWQDRANASLYASHSVTRFNIKTKIIEPRGYLEFATDFTRIFSSSDFNDFTDTIIFKTGSAGTNIISSSIYNNNSQLVSIYTSSFVGKPLSASEGGFTKYQFTGSIIHDPSGENGVIINSPTTSSIVIYDTPSVKIDINKIEIGSGSVSDNKGEFDSNELSPDIIKRIPFNSSSTIGDPDLLNDNLEPHSLTRFRILTKITEPKGWAHYPINIKYQKQKDDTLIGIGIIQTFSTNSTDIFTSTSGFIPSTGEYESVYTSSFIPETLEESNNFYQFLIRNSNITLNDNDTEPDFSIIGEENASDLYFKVSSSQTDKLEISDIVVEVESASNGNPTGFGSNIGFPTLTSSLLFGLSSSLISSQTNSLITLAINGGSSHPKHLDYISGSLIRLRVKAKITQPFGDEIQTITSSFRSPGSQEVTTVTNVIETKRATGIVEVGGNSNNLPLIVNGTFDFTNDSDFNVTRGDLRLVTMSIKGDVDNLPGESFTDLVIGSNQIITTFSRAIPDGQNQSFVKVLPFNLRQTDDQTTDTIIFDENAILTLPNEGNFTNSISITDGLIPLSVTLSADPDGGGIEGISTLPIFPFIISGTFEYDVTTTSTEVVTDSNIIQSKEFIFNDQQLTDVVSSSAFELFNDNLPRIVSRYTSSFVDIPIPTGSFIFSSFFTSASDSTFTSSFNSANSQSAIVSMSNTIPTTLSNLKYETEKFGHSESGSNDANIVTVTTRSVLYGDNSITNPFSESIGDFISNWSTHPSASVYASHSVTRFRVKGQIVEPFGPANSTLDIKLIISSSDNDNHFKKDNDFINIDTATSDNLIFNNNNQLITTFTSSFSNDIRLSVINPSNIPSQKENFIVSGTTLYSVHNLNNNINPIANNLTISNPTLTKVHVIDTPATEITVNKIETETFGESNIGISNNNESTPGIISRSILYNETTTRGTGSGVENLFTSSVVTKFRVLSTIIEPLGYLHSSTSISLQFTGGGDNNNNIVEGHKQTFSTNSLDIFNLSPIYDLNSRLVTRYTSSFTGSQLAASNINGDGYWEATASSIVHNPSGENGNNFTDNNSQLYFVVSQSFSNITQPTISNLRLEVETTKSGSNTFGFIRSTNILHGSQSTETDHTRNAGYTGVSKDSLVSVRVIATIEEPPGIQHNPVNINIGGHSGDLINISFSTASNDTASSDITLPTSTQGLIGRYTSSLFAVPFKALGFQPNDTQEERLTYNVSASITSMDNVSSFTLTPSSTPSHSAIHVTGALSSSIAISVNSSSATEQVPHRLSSSFFDSSDTEETLYFVYPSGDNLGYDGNLKEVHLVPTLITTPPTFTSESNITFNRGHLDVSFTSSNRYLDFNDSIFSFTQTTNPSDGTASLYATRPSYELHNDNNANTVRGAVITVRSTDLLEGNGTNVISKSIFVIPASAVDMTGDLTFNIAAHPDDMKDKLYFGLLSSESFDNYSGSAKPLNPDTHISSSRILYASTSVGYNYSMSFFTHPDDTAIYSNGNSLGTNFLGIFETDNRAYNFGDTGSLELKINGNRIITASLQDNFNKTNKGTSQVLSGYDTDFTNGTASFTVGGSNGRLILTKVAPFNNVSQSIFVGNTFFSNGFQAWNASIHLDGKIRDGYNILEFIHNISSNVTQSLNKFEWFYNDGIDSGSIKSNQTMSYSAGNNNPTHSLSGVSYFKEDIEFTASIDEITNLANKVYPHNKSGNTPQSEPIFFTTRSSSDTELTVKGDGQSMNSNKLQHILIDGDISRKGLRFSEDINNYVPTSKSTASINLIVSADLNNETSYDPVVGKIYNLAFQQNLRDKSSEHEYKESTLLNTSIGRFAKSGSNLSNLNSISYVASSPLTASFFDEDRRWDSQSFSTSMSLSSASIGFQDYTLWTSPLKANYNSVNNITNTNDLQQLFTGELIYPSKSYSETSNPNIVDYSGISRNGKREYYIALSASAAGENAKNFNLVVSGNISKGDFPQGTSLDHDQGNINIKVRIPGPITQIDFNSIINPGTEFGAATGGQNTTPVNYAPNFNMNSLYKENLTNEAIGRIVFGFDFGFADAINSQGILLLKVSISGSIHNTGSIKQISIHRT